MRSPITPPFARLKGASIAQAGFVMASCMIAGTVFCIPFGLASDRFGRRKMMISGLLVSCAGSMLFIPALDMNHMIIAYFLAGLGMAAYMPSMVAYVGDISRSEELGQAVGWYVTCMQLGTVCGSLLGGFVAEKGGYPLAFAFSGLSMLSAAIVAMKLRSPVALTVNKTVNIPKKSIIEGLTLLFGTLIVLASWSTNFCNSFSMGTLQTFFPLYILNIGLPLSLMGILFSIQNITGVTARFMVRIASKRFGGRFSFSHLLVTGLIISAGAIPLPTLFTSFSALAVVMTLIATGAAIVTTSSQVLLTEATDMASRGLAMGIYNSCMYGGMLSSSLLGGVVESYGFDAIFNIASMVLWVEALIVCGLIFVPKRKGFVQISFRSPPSSRR